MTLSTARPNYELCENCKATGKVEFFDELWDCTHCNGLGEHPDGSADVWMYKPFFRIEYDDERPTKVYANSDQIAHLRVETDGHFRITLYDRNGPLTHTVGDWDVITDERLLSGFLPSGESARKMLDHWSTTDKWERGLDAMAEIRKANS